MDNLAAEPVASAPVDRTVPAGIAMPAKKGGKGAVIAAIVFALIAVGLGVWLAILLLTPAKEKQNNCEAKEPTSNNGSAPVETTGYRNDEKVREFVKKAMTAWATAADYAAVETVYDDEATLLPISDSVQTFASHSYGFKTDSINSYAQARVEKNRASAEEALASEIHKAGLKKIDRPKNFGLFGIDKETFYGDDEIFCYSAWDSGSAYLFGCADKTWVSEKDKELDLALAKAYNAKNAEYPLGFINASFDNIKTNSEGTYETITANVNDAAALFYRKKGAEDWKFFIDTQSIVPCESYNTSELKEAYKGESCGNNGTVK